MNLNKWLWLLEKASNLVLIKKPEDHVFQAGKLII
jgi:hypothetical protein